MARWRNHTLQLFSSGHCARSSLLWHTLPHSMVRTRAQRSTSVHGVQSASREVHIANSWPLGGGKILTYFNKFLGKQANKLQIVVGDEADSATYKTS